MGKAVRIELARIDDRLIHGQVVLKWLRAVPCDEIVICDDGVRRDAFLQQVLRLASPRQMALQVLSVDECAAYLAQEAEGNAAPRQALLLCKSPATALALLHRGAALTRLNVGGIAAGPGSRRVYKSVSLTEEQAGQLAEIQSMGVVVYFQTVPEPEEKPTRFESLALARAHAIMNGR